ncbi:antitoxin Xre-like helix-turn-helix domain-containing protein [Deinococcus aerolatus]|nr:antitoxin Xre-like helix-turn-helix domain-containing protein [Deinococcus aerolatus]
MREPLMHQEKPNLTDPATASRLSRGLPAGVHMLQALGLSREEQASLLGLSVRSLQRGEDGHGPELSQDQLTRLSLVVGIYKALRLLYDDATAAGWPHRTNRRPPFGGQTPLTYMRQGGIPAMYETRRLLDADRGGLFSVTPEAHRSAPGFPTVVEL